MELKDLTILFLTIQLSISHLFALSLNVSLIWPIDRTLSDATTPSQSGLGNNGKEKILLIPKKLQHYWSLTIGLFSVISRTLVGEVLPTLQKCCQRILQPQSTGLGNTWNHLCTKEWDQACLKMYLQNELTNHIYLIYM